MMGRRFGDRRRGRHSFWRFTRLLVVVAAVAAVGSYAYRVGESAGHVRAAKLQTDLERFQKSDLSLRDRLTGLAQRSTRVEKELDLLRRRYARDVPQGRAAALVGRLRDQLLAGVDPERLDFLIGAAAQVDDCQSAPQTKRFILATGIGGTAASAVRFDDRITVTGRGRALRNEQGLTEAWYDPTQPVRLEFQRLDGEMEGVNGVLPLAHRMVVGDRELRFSIIAGERSFVEVTAQVCALPTVLDPAADQAASPTPPATPPVAVTPPMAPRAESPGQAGRNDAAALVAPATQAALAGVHPSAETDGQSGQNEAAVSR
jgi:hypothetical protein